MSYNIATLALTIIIAFAHKKGSGDAQITGKTNFLFNNNYAVHNNYDL